MNIKGRLYRFSNKLIHRFNLHYAPPCGPSKTDSSFMESNHHWCMWCGLRGDVVSKKKGIDISKINQTNGVIVDGKIYPKGTYDLRSDDEQD